MYIYIYLFIEHIDASHLGPNASMCFLLDKMHNSKTMYPPIFWHSYFWSKNSDLHNGGPYNPYHQVPEPEWSIDKTHNQWTPLKI